MEKLEKLDLSKISLGDFQKIINVKGEDNIEKYVKIFNILGVDGDNMEIEEFLNAVKIFTGSNFHADSYKKSLEIGDYKYNSDWNGDKFILKVKESSLIEKYILEGGKDWLIYSIAVIFKREDLGIENYEQSHIKWKMELFKDIKLKDVYKYYLLISEKFTNKIKSE